MEDKHIDIEAVVVNGRHRRDMGDLAALKESIDHLGLIHPVVVTTERQLIAGHRRLEALRELGWSSVPVRFMDHLSGARDLLEAERDENTCRLDMKPSEKVALGSALEELEQPKAEARRLEGNRVGGRRRKSDKKDDRLPRVNDIVGETVGMSGPSYSRAKAVVRAAQDGNPVAQEAMSEMDSTGKILPAYRKVVSAPAESKPNRQPLATKRQREIAQKAHRLLSKGLYGLEGTCAGFDEVDLSRVLAVTTPEELLEWDCLLTKAIKSLNGFHRKLKKERETA